MAWRNRRAHSAVRVGRTTRGNFRLLHRPFVQSERVLRMNDLTVVTSDVIEAARSAPTLRGLGRGRWLAARARARAR